MSAALTLEPGALEARIKTTVGELLQNAETMRNLGELLDEFADLQVGADADQLRQAATGIRATAMQALLASAAAITLSERLATIGYVRESAQEDADG